MIITDLKYKLDNEFLTYYEVVLVNGTWGIGKTFYLNEYLNDKRHIYVSLFGLNSMEELKYGLYYELNKHFARLKKAAKSFSGSSFGISIFSLPLPNFKFDIEKSIKKELKEEKIILVIDDLERKSENISIRELLGFVENLSQIEGMKVLLVANENLIPEKDKEYFDLFKEKVVNKTYNIDKYSPDAVFEISNKLLKEDSIRHIIDNKSFLEAIGEIIANHNIKNLRTLSKAILFSKIILSKVNDKTITINDKKEIILASFAVVIEKTDGLYFPSRDNEELDYCILKNYFKGNVFDGSKLGIVKPIIALYLDQNIEANYLKIKDYYFVKHNVNPEEKNIFYCSEEEVELRIKKFITTSIEKVNKKLNINLWFKEFSNIYPWAEKIEKKELFDKSKIELIMDKYAQTVDVNDNLYEIMDRTMPFMIEHKELQKYYNIYKEKIFMAYFTKLIDKIKEDDSYNTLYLDNLFSVFSYDMMIEDKVIIPLINLIAENDFFIPDINGEITEKQWKWCHIMWDNCSRVTDKFLLKEKLYIFSQESLKSATSIGKHRINSLNEQYHIHSIKSD